MITIPHYGYKSLSLGCSIYGYNDGDGDGSGFGFEYSYFDEWGYGDGWSDGGNGDGNRREDSLLQLCITKGEYVLSRLYYKEK